MRSVGEYLGRWGFTPQKPLKRAYEQQPEAVKAWLGDRADRIEAFYLPSYSPELNPDERLNADLKHAITTQVPARTRECLKRKTTDHMTLIESSPKRVIAYFGDPKVSYAASHK